MATLKAKLGNAEPKEKSYTLNDELGLYLLVNLLGSKYWRLKFRLDGVKKLFACAGIPRSFAGRLHTDRGRHRSGASGTRRQARYAGRILNTFEALARELWANWRGDRTERHAD